MTTPKNLSLVNAKCKDSFRYTHVINYLYEISNVLSLEINEDNGRNKINTDQRLKLK